MKICILTKVNEFNGDCGSSFYSFYFKFPLQFLSSTKEDILLYPISFVVIVNESSTSKPDYLSYAKPVFRTWIGSGFNGSADPDLD